MNAITRIEDVTLANLRERATLIHYFGLGFIQVKLDADHRLHFYTAELPATVGEEEVHSHRYAFTSTVLAGALRQELFAVVDGQTHVLEDETCREGCAAPSAPRPCGVRLIVDLHMAAGTRYRLAHDAFHRVGATWAITSLEREPVAQEFAQVIRPVGAPKVCPFAEKVPEERLWETVARMIERAKA